MIEDVSKGKFVCLLDTGPIIAHLRNITGMMELFNSLVDEGQMAVAAVSVTEIWQGAKEREIEPTRHFFTGVKVIPLDEQLATRAGLLARGLRAQGFTASLADAVIAVTALQLQVPLLTTNPKHFTIITGLEVWDLQDKLAELERGIGDKTSSRSGS
ncbi:tRNA(fMet)-specific endonuclease VapC [Neomoorella glycerini]|uniref:tRNA(fMet)-specific endonuclease VapC n=1 Tax=Neomoorella glycerini TaxID=55779 RepID=A0A6I5ZLV3_9FIRM|nr:PIN domain-containing protein [Moorella glycerini]QGP90793.1 tRNA(fMet)-specific endonuclease VapC [Moorella glycerini]